MKPTVRTRPGCLIGLVLAIAGIGGVRAFAADYVNGFDTSEPSWRISNDERATRIVGHRRNRFLLRAGKASEHVEVLTSADAARIQFSHTLPASRITGIAELKLSVWFKSSRDGARLRARVVFPHLLHPETGRPTAIPLSGDEYKNVGAWQELHLGGFDAQLDRELPRFRARMVELGLDSHELDLSEAYVDQASILVETGPGPAEYFMDELRFGPCVPYAPVSSRSEKLAPPVREAALSHPSVDAQKTPEIEIHLDRLVSHGKPIFPRFVPYHGEQPSELARLRMNFVWVSDAGDQAVVSALRQQGLRVMATPPESGLAERGNEVSLAPFGTELDGIAMFNLGTRLPANESRIVEMWARQVRDADVAQRRPLMVDVSGQERTYSRLIPLIGISRHPFNTMSGFKSYRNYLIERRQLAHPSSIPWTWIQTEPSPSLGALADRVIIEPEQIRLQTYAALSAGYRGIGFWKETPISDDRPGSVERQLMLSILGFELELLEPWLATGTVVEQRRFNAQIPKPVSVNQLALGNAGSGRSREQLKQLLTERDHQLKRQQLVASELEATMIRSDYGMLLLPVWLSETAQFVPDQLAVSDASIVVPGLEEATSAWELTPTGLVNRECKRTTAGHEVKLPKFDMTTALIFTTDQQLISRIRMKIEAVSEAASQSWVELARAKLVRVREVDRVLHELGVGQPDAVRILGRAQYMLDEAQRAYVGKNFDGARVLSADCLQLLRILQHAYWWSAVRDLYSPVSSPYTMCFQTLPDHWRLLDRFARGGKQGEALLKTGDFEDFDAAIQEGWKRSSGDLEGLRAEASLHPRPHQGDYSLRLVAVPQAKTEAPTVLGNRLLSVTSAPVQVEAGQIVHISGWVKLGSGVVASQDGAMFYDSIGGVTSALRWRDARDWQKFSVIREVTESGPLTLNMSLTGLGEILIDDLAVVAYSPNRESAEPTGTPATPVRNRSFDILSRVPGFSRNPAPAAAAGTPRRQ